MLLLAAFKVLLYRYTAQDDILIGVAVANRNRSEIEPLIGFFVNMLPLRTDLSGNPKFSELLKRVKAVALGGYAYQEMSFEKLVKELQPERITWEMPLFNIAFGVQNTPNVAPDLPGIKITPIITEQERARFDLTLWITENIDGMEARWTYSKDLFEEETVRRMHDHFETLLFSIVDRPDARLTTLNISSMAETRLNNNEQVDRQDRDLGKPTSIKRRAINLPTVSS